ncbi:MAG TPA: hypothetical protein VNN08_22735 [Thermoanaerobaculia bacterium]|nr:hypothetical protein [Thermoanaerobaculia bacterium]
MPNVSVHFAGVVAVGPARPRVVGPQWSRNGPFYAVFPPSTRRKVANDDPSTSDFIPFHIPALITKVKNTSGRHPDQTSAQLSAWFPFRERLVFNITPNDESVLTYEHTDMSPLRDHDVDLIADFRDFWPAVAMMPADAVDMNGDPRNAPTRVHGQVFIPFGHVSSDTGTHKRKKVQFKPPRPIGSNPTDARDIVSQAVITFPAEEITISSQSLDTGEDLDEITFAITNDATFYIVNADPQDMFKYPLNEEIHVPEMGSDADFELYYTLLAPGVSSDLPIPVEHRLNHFLVKDCYVAMTDIVE